MNLIVFDIDDTLTKSEYQHQLAYVSAMRDLGILNINQNWSEYKHHTDSYILKKNYENNFLIPFEMKLVVPIEIRMTAIMLTLEPVEAIRGAQHFVDYVRHEKNYAVAFATGSLLQPALLKLQQAGIWHEKELIAASNHFYQREAIVADAIERAKQYYDVVAFENIISIGDGLWDWRTAQNLNVHFIGVGMKNFEDFIQAKIKIHTEHWESFDFEHAEETLLNDQTNSI